MPEKIEFETKTREKDEVKSLTLADYIVEMFFWLGEYVPMEFDG